MSVLASSPARQLWPRLGDAKRCGIPTGAGKPRNRRKHNGFVHEARVHRVGRRAQGRIGVGAGELARPADHHDLPLGAGGGTDATARIVASLLAKLVASLKKAYDSKEYKDFMSSRGFGVKWGDSQEFAKFMDAGDEQMGKA